jgi:glycosyltransferase involved in cell wall biosynthesis
MDGATLLCLPSRAEGLGRVVVEAMLRGRAVVGGNAGGIPDLVEDEVSGLLVDVGDPSSLADALVRVLADRELAEAMGAAARRRGEDVSVTPEEYAENVAAVIRGVLEG